MRVHETVVIHFSGARTSHYSVGGQKKLHLFPCPYTQQQQQQQKYQQQNCEILKVKVE